MISIILWISAAACFAMVWTLENRRFKAEPPDFAWWGSMGYLRAYFDNNPAAGPSFFGSTTFLNFTTNAVSFFSTLTSWLLAGAVATFDATFWFFLPIPLINSLWLIILLLIHRLIWWLVFKLVKLIT